jgi:hypothetical protein
MVDPKPERVELRAVLDELIDVTFESVHGNAQHASRLVGDVIEEKADIDIGRELAAFWTRVGGDTARAVKAAQGLLDQIASAQPQPSQPQTTAGPAAATGSAGAVCIDKQTLGPFRAPGTIQPQTLRRRGDTQPSVASNQIEVSPTSVTRDAAELQITVDCGGVPRGIYTGSLLVGSDEYHYDIYLDPQ